MDSSPSLPPVVAVVVTCDPGPWFEETLQAFAQQDYLNLSVLVIDAASADDPTPRVAAILPTAYVRRIEHRVAFGSAANEILGIVEGASHYVFCHDDVAPDPSAIRALVEEAYRSNAAIVAPKLVDWHHPERLLDVGLGADRVGVVHSMVDPGELDQEQHDSVREVFVAPGPAVLVRADMFAILGGFDPVVDHAGEDLNLSWRAHIAGGRVIVAPAARFRHLAATSSGRRRDPAPGVAVLSDTNRIRTLLTCYSLPTLLWVLPTAVFFSLGEVVTLLVTGHPAEAGRRIVSGFRALGHPIWLLRSRRAAQRHRTVSDRRACRLQSRGNARLRAWMNAKLDGPSIGLPFASARRGAVPGTLGATDDDDTAWEALVRPTVLARREAEPARSAIVALPTASTLSAAGGRPPAKPDPAPTAEIGDAAAIGSGTWRLPVLTGAVLLALFLVGSRSLLNHAIPDVGQLPVTSAGVGRWWSAWLSTWQPAGLGSIGSGAPALGLLSLAGAIFFGGVGTLQHVLVLGPFIIGAIGAYRAARWWGSQRGRLAALVAYALVPLPYDALAQGHWDGLLAYAAAPWVIGMVARLSDSLPFPATPAARIAGRVLGLGVLTAVVGAFVPSYLLVVIVVGAGLALGSLLVAQPPVAVRCFAVGLVGAIVGFVLLLPWSGHVIADRAAMFGAPAGPAGRLTFSTLLRMHTGPIGAGPLGWGLLAAAALPLVIGRSWRLAWAARLWMVALLSVVWAWAGLRGWLPAPDPEVVLAPACAALAGAVGLGVVAFELDLPGYRFGWRQAASVLAAFGLLVTAFPIVVAVGSGTWNLPTSGPSNVLSVLDHTNGGDYRLLWIGAPSALPLASAPLGGGEAYATSFDGLPDVTDQWPGGAPAGGARIRADLALASGGLTTELGHLLAPLGVRYLVIPNRNGPAGSGALAVPTPNRLLAGLLLQTDLRPIPTDTDYTVYVNASWAPVRINLPTRALSAANASGPNAIRALQTTSLAGAAAPLTGSRQDRARGTLAGGSAVYIAATPSRYWQLHVGGRVLTGTPAFGVGTLFKVPAGSGGSATLVASTSGSERAAQLLFAGLWVIVLAVVAIDRWRRSRAGAHREMVQAEWFTALAPHRRRSTRRDMAVPNAPVGMDSDEVWVDA